MTETSPISPLLDQIRKRPGMFLGSKSLTGLYHFINGYDAGYGDACRHNNFKNISDQIIPRSFHDWCAYRTHFNESTSGWRNMICSVTAVSYTHLRAHETSLHLVCRLLLEKNIHTYSR